MKFDLATKLDDSKLAEEYVMRKLIKHYLAKGQVLYTIREAKNVFESATVDGLRILGIFKRREGKGYITYTISSQYFLATFFRPVSDAILDGKTVDEVIALWKKTKASKENKVKRPSRALQKLHLQGTAMASNEY